MDPTLSLYVLRRIILIAFTTLNCNPTLAHTPPGKQDVWDTLARHMHNPCFKNVQISLAQLPEQEQKKLYSTLPLLEKFITQPKIIKLSEIFKLHNDIIKERASHKKQWDNTTQESLQLFHSFGINIHEVNNYASIENSLCVLQKITSEYYKKRCTSKL